MNKLPKRKQNRLKNYDYSQNGFYHITICTAGHKKILSSVESSGVGKPEIALSGTGLIVDNAIKDINNHYNNVNVVKHIIMPKHIHLLLQVEGNGGRQIVAPTISTVIMQLKRVTSMASGESLWQKGFYDHIIKNDSDFENVCIYIDENPVKWENDEYY